MTRRRFLGGGLALTAASMMPSARANSAARWVTPGSPGWPAASEWEELKRNVGGRLSPVVMPDTNDPAVRALLRNPFYIGDQPGLTQNAGWLDAWRSRPSTNVVEAESAADVAATVDFAREHNVRLVVRGGGHSFLGTSSAPDSLLLRTRKMNAITVHDAFTPVGSKTAPVPAVSAGAGCIWLHVYQAVTGGAGRYVQGGGCTTVGVPGLVLGGGFGSFSKAYGTAAASLLEAEIVTADGRIRIVSDATDPDLFWALKGGGGGTFGVITRVTLATHDLPETFGVVSLDLHATADEAYRQLLVRFVDLYATQLHNLHWGERAMVGPGNRLRISMMFQGLNADEARAAWKPLMDFVDASSADYEGHNSFKVTTIPARYYWNADVYRNYAPSSVVFDSRQGAAPTDFWWKSDTELAGAFWYTLTSLWLPGTLLEPRNRARFADAWFAASRHWGFELAFNKGLGGGSAAAVEATRNTAMSPDVLDAFGLVIIGHRATGAFPDPPPPELARGKAAVSRVQAALSALREVAPETGAYVNECDYFQPDWRKAFWGPNHSRLRAIKQRYDAGGIFTVHHGVGSEI